MVTYNDVKDAEEGKELLDSKRAEEKAHSILNSELFQQEEEVKTLENASGNDEVTAIAQDALQTMQEMESSGQDPMGFLQQLPPNVQEKIAQILDGGNQQQGMQQQAQQGMQQAQQGSGNAMADLTSMSKQLAGGM